MIRTAVCFVAVFFGGACLAVPVIEYVMPMVLGVNYQDANATFQAVEAKLAYTPPPAPPAPKLTMDRYESLQPRMNKLDVLVALGVPGTEVSQAGSLETRIYRDGDRFVIVTFQGQELVAKLQSGL